MCFRWKSENVYFTFCFKKFPWKSTLVARKNIKFSSAHVESLCNINNQSFLTKICQLFYQHPKKSLKAHVPWEDDIFAKHFDGEADCSCDDCARKFSPEIHFCSIKYEKQNSNKILLENTFLNVFFGYVEGIFDKIPIFFHKSSKHFLRKTFFLKFK